MTPGDLARLHAEAFTTPRPWSAEEFASLLQSPFVFLLTESNGFLLGRVVAGEAELLTLAVLPAARRKGIGSRLVANFLTEARHRNADQAFLEVAADNHSAISVYSGANFTESGRRRAYYHPPAGPAVDALVLTRPL